MVDKPAIANRLREIPRLGGAALVVLSAFATGCEPTPTREWTPADHGQPSTPPADGDALRAASPEAEVSAENAEARAARALWLAACAQCHGREGRGDGPGIPPGARVPDLTLAATLEGKTDLQLASVIRDGRGMMPAFGKQVVPAGIEALVRQVRVLAAAALPAEGAGAGSTPTSAPASTPASAPTKVEGAP